MPPAAGSICCAFLTVALWMGGEAAQAASTAEQSTPLVAKVEHAQRWLDANRGRLSPRQIALVEETIAFLSSADSRPPQSPDVIRYADDLQHRLTCQLGRSNVMAAFTFLDPPKWNLVDAADEWLEWISNCAFRD